MKERAVAGGQGSVDEKPSEADSELIELCRRWWFFHDGFDLPPLDDDAFDELREVDDRTWAYGEGPIPVFAEFIKVLSEQAPDDAGLAYIGTWFLEDVDDPTAYAVLEILEGWNAEVAGHIRSGFIPLGNRRPAEPESN